MITAFLIASAALCSLQPGDPVRHRSDPDHPDTGLRLQDFRVHDPFILAHEPTQTYYLYTSGRRRNTDDGARRSGVVAYTSPDLMTWSGPQLVFEVPDGAWANPAHGTWAPEVHEYRGRWYLFVTLHDNDAVFMQPPEAWREMTRRGTVIAVADSPDGPFELINPDRPHTPWDFMALDGTLYIDPEGDPWLVYCHEWIQKIDGTVEAIRLTDDLTATVGEPIHLFKGSDAPWINAELEPGTGHATYVTDGCGLYRTQDGSLVMLWASWSRSGYVQTIARSTSGTLEGPWEQLEPLVWQNSGHGMMFDTFEGERLMVLHRPFGRPETRAKVYQMRDTGESFEVVRQRKDIDGDP